MEKLKCAISFLTIIPIKADIKTQDDFRDMILYFPLVGMILGLIYFFMCDFSYVHTSSYIFSSIIYVVLSVVCTGGLHYDGLADSCDGIFSRTNRQRTLDIMSDSRVGTFGVLGIVLNIILKLAIINVFLDYNILFFAVFSVIFSRTMLVVLSYIGKYAKKDGMGNYFIGKISKKIFITSLSLSILISLILSFLFSEDIYKTLIVLIISSVISLVIMLMIKKNIDKKLGGITGDILGFSSEISENIFLYTVFVVIKFMV